MLHTGSGGVTFDCAMVEQEIEKDWNKNYESYGNKSQTYLNNTFTLKSTSMRWDGRKWKKAPICQNMKNRGLHGALSKITNFQKSTYKKNNKLGILLVVVGMVSVGCLLL